MEKYIGTKMIKAEPEMKDGKEGYKVEYADGYVSWSPKAAFEEAYRKNGKLSFGIALDLALKGYSIRREFYKSTYIKAQFPDVDSKMNTPYLYTHYAMNVLVPYTPTQIDLFANDWEVVDDV